MSATSMDFKNFANIWLMRFQRERLSEVGRLYQRLQACQDHRTRSRKQMVAEFRQQVDSELWSMAKEIEEFKGEASFLRRYHKIEDNMIKCEHCGTGLTTYELMGSDWFYIFHIHTPYSEMKDDGKTYPSDI